MLSSSCKKEKFWPKCNCNARHQVCLKYFEYQFCNSTTNVYKVMLVRGSSTYDCIVVNKKVYHKITMLGFSVISVTDVRVNRAECQIMKCMPNKRIFLPTRILQSNAWSIRHQPIMSRKLHVDTPSLWKVSIRGCMCAHSRP